MNWLERLRRYTLTIRGLVRDKGFRAALGAVRGRLQKRLGGRTAVPSPREWRLYYRKRSRAGSGQEEEGHRIDPGKVSILISVHGDPLLGEICLRSVLSNTKLPAFEVIVIQNGEGDGHSEWLTLLAAANLHVRVVMREEGRSVSIAREEAARAAGGDYLVFLDDNAVVPPDWIEPLLAHMQADAQIGLVGPVTNAAGNEARIETEYSSPSQMEALAADRAARMRGQSFDIRMLELSGTMSRKQQFDSIRGLNAGFETGVFEAEDLAMRYRRQGLRVVCAKDAFVHHFARGLPGALNNDRHLQLFDQERSRFEKEWGVSWKPHQFWQVPLLPQKDAVQGPAPATGPEPVRAAQTTSAASPALSNIFVIGCPRSGTSALSWALAEHPALWTSEELDILPYMLGTPWLREQYGRAAGDPERQNWFVRHHVSYAEFAASIGSGLDSLMRSRSQGRIWVDSTPDNTLVADQLVVFFPNARFLHIIRDGRDVVNSMLNAGFSSPEFNDFDLACATWVRYVKAGSRLLQENPGRVYEMRNERLVSAAGEEFNRVYRFLGLPPCQQSAIFVETQRINSSYLNVEKSDIRLAKDPARMPIRPWQSWTRRQQKAFTRIAGDTMTALGYPLSFK